MGDGVMVGLGAGLDRGGRYHGQRWEGKDVKEGDCGRGCGGGPVHGAAGPRIIRTRNLYPPTARRTPPAESWGQMRGERRMRCAAVMRLGENGANDAGGGQQRGAMGEGTETVAQPEADRQGRHAARPDRESRDGLPPLALHGAWRGPGSWSRAGCPRRTLPGYFPGDSGRAVQRSYWC